MYIRKADQPEFNDAVSTAMLSIQPQLTALADVLPGAIYGTRCPDHIFEAFRKEVMNEIGQQLFTQIIPPLTADGV